MKKHFLALIFLGLISLSACNKSAEEQVIDDLKEAGIPPAAGMVDDAAHRDYCSSMRTRGRSPDECQEFYASEKK